MVAMAGLELAICIYTRLDGLELTEIPMPLKMDA